MTALIREMVENRCQNHSKIDAKMYQNRLQKKAKRKNTKSVKTNNPPSFLLDFSKLRESKNQENLVVFEMNIETWDCTLYMIYEYERIVEYEDKFIVLC